MFDCLILGDSIAQGVAQSRPECMAIVQKGVTSEMFKYEVINRPEFTHKHWNTLVISLGTNDNHWDVTEIYLRLLRERVKADKVWWILPQAKFHQARNAVILVADTYGDQILEVLDKNLEKDKIHPNANGYKEIAEQTKK